MVKKILTLAIPNVLSNISTPLLGMVDTALMGHLGAAYFIGAIAVGGLVFNFLYWGFGFLRMGTTGMVAQAVGQGDDTEVNAFLSRALVVAIAMGLVIILLRPWIATMALSLIQASADVSHYAAIYIRIRIYAAPATLALYCFQGWFMGQQNAVLPMVLMLVTNSLNVLLSLLFIRVYGLGVAGVAWGTVISQCVGVLLALAFSYHIRGHWWFRKQSRVFDGAKLKQFLHVNRDLFIRTLCLIITFSTFKAYSARANDNVLAANEILLQFWMLMSFGLDGFAFAAESLVGFEIGKRDRRQLTVVIGMIFKMSLGLAALYVLVFGLFHRPIIGLFTGINAVVDCVNEVIIWTIIAPLINVVCYIWDGVYIGATATRSMRNSMFMSMSVFLLPILFLSQEQLGVHGLWLALLGFMAVRGLLMTATYKRDIVGP